MARTTISLIDLNKGSRARRRRSLRRRPLVYNYAPGETRKPSDLGATPRFFVTSRGFGLPEMEKIATWMDASIKAAKNDTALAQISKDVAALCAGFPVPGID